MCYIRCEMYSPLSRVNHNNTPGGMMQSDNDLKMAQISI